VSVERRSKSDPPDEPTEPELSFTLKSVLSCLPELSSGELYLVKEAVVGEQMKRESALVLTGMGVSE